MPPSLNDYVYTGFLLYYYKGYIYYVYVNIGSEAELLKSLLDQDRPWQAKHRSIKNDFQDRHDGINDQNPLTHGSSA